MTGRHEPTDDRLIENRRRRAIGLAVLAGLTGTGLVETWYATRGAEVPDDGSLGPPPAGDSDRNDAEELPPLVRRYAPDLYYGALEKWFPTDPRQYVVESADGPVVDGFAALEDYTTAFAADGEPPAPTVFYHVAPAADGVDAIQFWMYSAFDQFTVNFHWHDWELLQVFVDREAGTPLLVSASAHSRNVPNNEFVEPSLDGGRRPGILAEVGSHSSASELNDRIPSFERIPAGDLTSDVTNDLLDITARLTAPFAYGLPRDEGARLPFVMPALDGAPLFEHPELAVDRDAFIDERVTIGSWHGLASPPTHLPRREPGLVMAHTESGVDADVRYELEPIEHVRDAVTDFVGPQLSFEFVVPGFVENRFASHITSVGIPWEQERFTAPLADVTDPVHRQQIDGGSAGGRLDRVVGRVRQLRAGTRGVLDRVADEARPAIEDLIAVSLYQPPAELAVRLASPEPVASVTRAGEFGFLHVTPGEHELVVNGPGYSPLGLGFEHGGGLIQVGAGGELTVVANEDAAWIRGDGGAARGIRRVRVIEEYAGVVYDGQPVEPDRFAVAVHAEGRYTVELVDADGTLGAYRVGPETFGDDGEDRRDLVETGTAVLATALSDELSTLAELASTLQEADDASQAVIEHLRNAIEAAVTAAAVAGREGSEAADEWLEAAISELAAALEILESDRRSGYSKAAVAALRPRVIAGIDRARTARASER